ncbi:cytochrome c1-1, heme protein, mitochondrial-like protein isoform X1, partial [Tanacetum coccineum]
MGLILYRDLVGAAYTEEETKAMAAEIELVDGPNDEGEMFTRHRKLSDRFTQPYPTKQAARFANGGAYPPDLSLITKATDAGAYTGKVMTRMALTWHTELYSYLATLLAFVIFDLKQPLTYLYFQEKLPITLSPLQGSMVLRPHTVSVDEDLDEATKKVKETIHRLYPKSKGSKSSPLLTLSASIRIVSVEPELVSRKFGGRFGSSL